MAKIKSIAIQRAIPRDWSPGAMVKALRAARKGDRVGALKRSGILTRDGKLSPTLRSWGKKVSRTPDAKLHEDVGFVFRTPSDFSRAEQRNNIAASPPLKAVSP